MYVLCTISGLKGLSLEYCNKLLLFESKISGRAPTIFYANRGEGGRGEKKFKMGVTLTLCVKMVYIYIYIYIYQMFSIVFERKLG